MNRLPPIALLALLALSAGRAAAEESDDPAKSIRAADLRAHVEFLSSDDLEGRATLQRGNELAAKYIAAQMRRIGLSPAGPEGSFFQDVPLWVSDYKYNWFLELRLTVGGHPVDFQAFRDFTIAAESGHDSATGGIVFAGYGITAPEYGYDDYRNVSAKGNVVVVFRHEPQENDGKSVFAGKKLTKHASFEAKAANAAAHGAAALLVMNDPLGGHDGLFQRVDIVPDQLVHRTNVSFEKGEDPRIPEGGLPVVLVDDATALRILGRTAAEMADLQKSLDADLGPHGFQSEGEVFVRTQVAARLQTTEQKFSHNVVGLLAGADGRRQKETVVVGAHYDSLGIYGSDDDRIHNGANDNATGVAAMLEIAEAVAAMRDRPARSILFVAFTGEELGCLGSQWYASHPLAPIADTAAMIDLDSIGRDEKDDPANAMLMTIAGAGTSPDWRDLVQPKSGALKLTFSADDPVGGDHLQFRAKGVPAIQLFAGLNSDSHGVGDSLEKIRFEKVEAAARLAFLVATDVASRPGRLPFRDPGLARPEHVEAAARIVNGSGLMLRVLTEEEAAKQGFASDVAGLRVLRSARADLKEGDVIIEAGDAPIRDVEGFLELVAGAKGRSLSLFVMRPGGDCHFSHLSGADLEGWKKP